MQELAVTAFEDLFLPVTLATARPQHDTEEAQSTLARRREVMSKGRLLVSIVAEYRDRSNPLEDVLRMVRLSCNGTLFRLMCVSYRYSRNMP